MAERKMVSFTQIKTAKGTKFNIRQYDNHMFDILGDDGNVIHENVALVMVLSVVRDE